MGVSFRTGLTGALSNQAFKITPKTLIVVGLSVLLIIAAAFGFARAQSNQLPKSGANLQLDMSSSSVSPAVDESTHSKSSATIKQHYDTSAEVKATNTDDGSTTLRVNNQDVPVPENGTFHKHIKTNGGNVEVHIESSSNQSSKSSSRTSDNSSSIEIETNSSSHGGTSVQKEESID